MRTRRSWRNQDRLWRAYCGEPKPPTQGPRKPRCFTCVNYPKGGRSGCKCKLTGTRMNGAECKPECYKPTSA